MKNIKVFFLSLIGVFLFCSALYGQDPILDSFIYMYDDFNGDSINTSLWDYSDPDEVASVSNGFLHVVGPPYNVWLHLTLPQQLAGDFGIMVSFQNFLPNMPGVTGAPAISLQADWNDDSGTRHEAWIQRVRSYGDLFTSGYWPGPGIQETPTSSTDGKLFILRRGSTFQMGYNDGTQTVVLQTFEEGWTGEVSLNLMFSTGYSGTFNVDVDYVKFDQLLSTTTIDDVLESVEDWIEVGDLVGVGEGESADRRLTAFVNMLQNAKVLFEDGDNIGGCDQLEAAYRKCDGESPPPDFVEGDEEVLEELRGMIETLELECE
jgi:hypothetical protein